MGKDRVAVCLAPARLNVNGENTEVGDGKVFSTPDGVDIWRIGNVYLITDANGNSVRAEVNPTWINLSLGLGKWPTKVSGLLANAGGNVNQIAARDGGVLTAPFAFQELYQRYGQSWRVAAEESLLSACGERTAETGNPERTFYAGDLDKQVYERTRGVCTAAGVKGDALVDACTLDVAVIGSDAAATVFVNARQPVAVGNIGQENGDEKANAFHRKSGTRQNFEATARRLDSAGIVCGAHPSSDRTRKQGHNLDRPLSIRHHRCIYWIWTLQQTNRHRIRTRYHRSERCHLDESRCVVPRSPGKRSRVSQ
jgi:hypothetical protein